MKREEKVFFFFKKKRKIERIYIYIYNSIRETLVVFNKDLTLNKKLSANTHRYEEKCLPKSKVSLLIRQSPSPLKRDIQN